MIFLSGSVDSRTESQQARRNSYENLYPGAACIPDCKSPQCGERKSKYAFLTYYKRFDEALQKYWCAPEKEPTLTTNDKKYTGYASVYNFLVECGEADTRRDNAIMRQLFPEELGEKKDSEMWGVGTAIVHTITTPVIELA